MKQMAILHRVRTEELKAKRRRYGDRGGSATSATTALNLAQMV